MWHNAPSEWSKPLPVLLCHQLSALWKKQIKRSFEVPQRVLPTYNTDRKPEVLVLLYCNKKLFRYNLGKIQLQLIDFI